MSYEIARIHEIHDAHQRVIDIFAKTYRCGQPTIVLLPGGMGSHLDRSTRPFVNDHSIPFPMYNPVWMDLEMIFGRDLDELQRLSKDVKAELSEVRGVREPGVFNLGS